MAVPYPDEEFCASCGSWVLPSAFDYNTGWCLACSPSPHCTRCGGVTDEYRTMCRTCRDEVWLDIHADELEYLVVTKGYSVSYARKVVSRIARPLCKKCRKPIKGGSSGNLFCKTNKRCHAAYNKYRRLVKAGMSRDDALREVT